MANHALKYEWGLQQTSGRDQRKTKRRWGPKRRGDRRSDAERMRRMRLKKVPLDIDMAVQVARRAIKAGRLPARGRRNLAKPGQKVNYNPLGLQVVMKGTFVNIWTSPTYCKYLYASSFVIVRRDRYERKRDKRLSKVVALARANVFCSL